MKLFNKGDTTENDRQKHLC